MRRGDPRFTATMSRAGGTTKWGGSIGAAPPCWLPEGGAYSSERRISAGFEKRDEAPDPQDVQATLKVWVVEE